MGRTRSTWGQNYALLLKTYLVRRVVLPQVKRGIDCATVSEVLVVCSRRLGQLKFINLHDFTSNMAAMKSTTLFIQAHFSERYLFVYM